MYLCGGSRSKHRKIISIVTSQRYSDSGLAQPASHACIPEQQVNLLEHPIAVGPFPPPFTPPPHLA